MRSERWESRMVAGALSSSKSSRRFNVKEDFFGTKMDLPPGLTAKVHSHIMISLPRMSNYREGEMILHELGLEEPCS